MSSNYDLFKFGVLIIFLKWAGAQEKYDEPYLKNGHLNEIPNTFELKGDSAKAEFKKYANDIQALSMARNVTVVYKVRVDLQKPLKRKNRNKKMFKKLRTKKYNVPLKRQNMKLSYFEVLLRKLAEEHGQKLQNYDVLPFTTRSPEMILTTKQVQLKYKPVISQVKTNYTKIIKPVRNKIITLTV